MADYVTVGRTDEISPGEMKLVELEDESIAIANVNGEYYAFSAECTHAGGPLDEGELDGTTLTCPWHGGEFNITTGKVLNPPPDEGITTYKIKIEGTEIKIAR